MVNVAFFTLLERKILGLAQRRKGPNKVAISGLLQPFADAVKLFLKEVVRPTERNIFFLFSPLLGLILVLFTWWLAPLEIFQREVEITALLLLVLLRIRLYPLLLAGWTSNRKYALIGAIRGVAQTLSYEIRLAVVFFCFFCIATSFRLFSVSIAAHYSAFVFIGAPLLALWIVSCIAETNRTPFDFAEGESELVSGFNIEYGGGLFAIIFIAEYARIMFFSLLTSQFLGFTSNLTMIVFTLVFCFIWVWVRATLPRFRYDILIRMAWKVLLPSALGVGWFIVCLTLVS